MSNAQLAAAFDAAVSAYSEEQEAKYYDDVLEFSDFTYDDNMKLLGYVDLDSPSAINIYASSFENKDVIEDAIAAYNEGRDDLEQITYTDYVGLMMSSVTPIITGYQRSKMPILRCLSKRASQTKVMLIFL